MSPELSIIIVQFKGLEWTLQCLRSLTKCAIGLSYEIIVVDNHSNDHSVQVLREHHPSITIYEMDDNKGFGAANNVGAYLAKGEYLFFLNNDTEIEHDCFTPLVDYLKHNPNVGIVGPQLRYPDQRFQLSYGKFPTPINEYRTKKQLRNEHRIKPPQIPMNVDWVTGAALCIPKNLFLRIGGFDEGFFMYFEDVDLCRRVRNEGFTIVYHPTCYLIHHRGKSYSAVNEFIRIEYRKSQLRYYTKHCSTLNRMVLKLYLRALYTLHFLFLGRKTQARTILQFLNS